MAATILLAACGGPDTPAALRLMSFNVRYATTADGPNAWEHRREFVIETIAAHDAHVVGTQEVLHDQLGALRHGLPRHRAYGAGREDGDTLGEYAALLVDTARLAVVDHGTFWLSDTPEVPNSMDWGNRITRICTWARLVDRTTGDTLSVYNVHFDHESQRARERSSALVLDRIASGNAGDGIVLMGDFNAGEDNPAFDALLTHRAGLVDTYRALHPNDSTVGTFNGFTGTSTGPKIDAILVGPRFEARAASIDRRHRDGRYPSDHFPVTATVRWRR